MLDHVDRLEAEIETLRDAVAAGRSRQRDFVRRASHDLAAPLRGLRSLTSFLREDAAHSLDADALELLDRVDAQVSHMQQIVTSLAVYARSGDLDTSIRPVTVTTIIEDALVAAEMPGEFHCTIDAASGVGHLPLTAVRNCLQPILENVRTHHHRDEGSVWVSATCVNRRVEFVIADDGPGLDQLTAECAFDPFRGRTSPQASTVRHAGMGLTIAAARASVHDASITIAPRRPSGTIVELSWPLVRPLPFSEGGAR